MHLRQSQIQAIQALKESSRLLLAEVGAGKTAVALSTIAARPRAQTLLVSTRRICRSVWAPETELWAPHLTYVNLAGHTPSQRSRGIAQGADITGINFENLPWLVEKLGKHLPTRYPQIIIDESSRLENAGSKAFSALKPFLPHFVWRLPMTGTPRANYLQDLWAHAYLADCGASLGRYKEAFRQKYFDKKDTPFGPQYTPKADAEDEIYACLRGCSHRLVFDGAKPGVITLDIPIELPEAIRNRLEKTRMKQAQVSSGAIYELDGSTTELHEEKLDALKDIIKSEPVIIVFNFIHEKDRIIKAFPQARIIDEKAIENWNKGQIDILLLHPRSAAHGLNLQKGGNTMVWFSPPPTVDGELYAQTVGRLVRPGQKSCVVKIIRLVTLDDATAYKAIEAKLDAQEKARI